MNGQTITIAPVKKTITVKASQAKAFDVFTAGVNRWWPREHHIGASPMTRFIMEPRKGGRWYSEHEDGSEVVTGHVLAWEPPSRLTLSWEINPEWKSSPSVYSEIEVRFTPVDASTTRVDLVHHKFEGFSEGGAKMRDQLDGGWPAVLDLFKADAER
jgi:uncharacterized protein YndB with AHSA1/START domain